MLDTYFVHINVSYYWFCIYAQFKIVWKSDNKDHDYAFDVVYPLVWWVFEIIVGA